MTVEAGSSEALKFEAADGYTLTGTYFPAAQPKAAVVVAPATAVARRLYRKFAQELAARGLSAFTFDYRGTGGSKPASLRGFGAAMHDWGELDLEAALQWMAQKHAALPLQVVGHSVGGQLLGMAPSSERVRAALFIGSQGGHWRHWSGWSRLAMFGIWHLLIPGISRALGFLPMKRFGQGEDLPKEVALEWARWGRQREYFQPFLEERGITRYKELSPALRAYAFADDWYAPRPAVEWLVRAYEGARGEVRAVAPKDVGHPQIGHFGAFHERFRPTLWREMGEWLLEQAQAPTSRRSA